MKDKKRIPVIIAPHYDDEIIGNFEILIQDPAPIIIYTCHPDSEREKEAGNLRKYTNVKIQYFLNNIPSHLLSPDHILYFPDPVYEIHPLHRKWGAVGEECFRNGLNVVFYSTNMNAPYIHEVSQSQKKRQFLNEIYSSQSDLWRYDHKYFLFEGRCKWIK